MIKLSPIANLKDTLPEDSWSWVIPALRQDPLIWESLQDQEFLTSTIRDFGGQPKKWSPMNLSLLSLGIGFAVDELVGTSLEEMSPYLHQQSEQAYQAFTSANPPSMDLKLAGLLALYFSEHPVKGKLSAPKTSLACLFELLHNPLDYLSQINPEDSVHAILSNPLRFEEQQEVFSQLLDRCDSVSQSGLLGKLSEQNPDLAAVVTQDFITNGGTPSQVSSADPKFQSIGNLSAILAEADIQSIAKRPGEHLTKATEAWLEAGQLQTAIAARLVTLEVSKGDIQAARTHWDSIKKDATIDQVSNILLTLCFEGYLDEALDWFENDFRGRNFSPVKSEHYLLHALLLNHKGDDDGALNAIEHSLAGFVDQNNRDSKQLHTTARLFLRLGQPEGALKAVNLILDSQPNNKESVAILLEALQAADHKDQAIKAAHLAVAFEPDRLEPRRVLAKTLENADHWSNAIVEREAILSIQESPTIDDKYHLSAAALKANQPHKTVEICKKIILESPNDSDAQYLLGAAYSDMGDTERAKTHLLEATQIAPGNAKAWLALADVHQQINQKSQRLETLQAASTAIPDDPEICLALGEIFLEDNTPTAALNHFRMANKLLGETGKPASGDVSSKVSLALGKTLLQLGHTVEARSILEAAYELDQQDIGIAHSYARSLLSSDLPEHAIPILETLLDQVIDKPEIKMDYAKACLVASTNIEAARDTLISLLDAYPDQIEAKAYLAEAYQINSEFDKALETYSDALNSPLHDDPSWNARLSLGLGTVSLAAGETETAIATLKNALLINGEDINILKTLSKAYLEAGLKENALWAAHSVMEIEPENEEHLEWFIKQAVALDAADKAIDVLSKYLDDDPQRPSLITKIGWLHIYNKDHEKAKAYFSRLNSLEQALPPDLYTAAEGLLTVGDPVNAMDCINKAIVMCETAGDQKLLPQLYISKSQAHKMNADLDQALETLDLAIAKSPADHLLYQKKAEIYLDLKQQDNATACLEGGIVKFPQNTGLRLQASVIHRAGGNLESAFKQTGKASELYRYQGSGSMDKAASSIIADLADALMQKGLASETIEAAEAEQSDSNNTPVDYYCLKGELALESGEEISAANALTAALNAGPNHPRVLALQSRMTLQQGDFDTAKHSLRRGLKAAGDSIENRSFPTVALKGSGIHAIEQPASTLIALAEAALELQQWDQVTPLLGKVVEIAPNEPRSHFKLARALVLCAENQRLSQLLDIVAHAPGKSATADPAYKQFEDSILKAAHLLTEYFPSKGDSSPSDIETNTTISTWLARGQAIFQPSTEHAQALNMLPKESDNLAAMIAAYRHCGDLKEAEKVAGEIYQDISEHAAEPHLLGQIALALTKNSPDAAGQAIKTAIEVSIWRNLVDRPVYNAIKAYIANRSQKLELQLNALNDAIEVWSDEPNWLSKAADLNLRNGDTDSMENAVKQLEQAAQLEPNQVVHYLKLGDTHQKLGNLKEAVNVLDHATRVIPNQTEPWMALARIHRLEGSLPQAIRCAMNVVQIDPSLPDSQILLAELSMEVDNPQKASAYIDGILEKYPENAEALLLRSEICQALDKPDEALESLERAMPNLAKSIPLSLKRVGLIEEVHGTNQAVDELKALSEEYPHDPQVLASLADALAGINDLDGSIKKAQAALSNGIVDHGMNDHIHILQLLGRNLRKAGQLDQAIHNLSEAIDQAPGIPGPYIELGRCYQEQRQFERSQQMMEKAIEAGPDDPQAYYFSGLLFKETKDYENAEVMFKQAAKLAPTNLNIHRQLGAVTAINLVHNRHGHSGFGHQSRLASQVEGME